jgi:transcriptional regulator with GAF, ATPase, and Fis domain
MPNPGSGRGNPQAERPAGRGAQAKVWIDTRSWRGPPSSEAIATALRAAGLHDLRHGSTDGAYGVVLIGETGGSVEGRLRELSGAGRRQVVAVAATPRLLEGGLTWRLLAAGAADVLTWDGGPDPAGQIAARIERWRIVDEAVDSEQVRETLVGHCPVWRARLRDIVEATLFTDSPVLLTGESGTGKELVARLIHTLDPRHPKGAFVVLDCTTVVPTLSGSEFFGHEKGAFTGAVSARDGAFATADRGTLFLDEVSELPLPLQAELLRVVQEGMYKRVGSNLWQRTSFRLVAATNRDLLQEESAGRFRRDLYYRMAGWAFRLPSLRERREDIPLLARHFLAAAGGGRSGPELSPAVEDLLRRREYPGNIRDLRQLIGRIVARHAGPGPITVGDVPPEDRPPSEDRSEAVRSAAPESERERELHAAIRAHLARGLTLRDIIQRAGDAAVSVACEDARGNLQRAARRLGVTDRALQLRRASGRAPSTTRTNGLSA